MWRRFVAPALWARLLMAGVLLGLVYRLPASWLAPLLPAGVRCDALSGSLWQGQCTGLEIDIPGRPSGTAAVSVGQIRWSWQPAAMLRGDLHVRLQLQQRATQASAQVALSPAGVLRVSSLRWRGPLDATLLPFLPPGLTGRLETDAMALSLRSGGLAGLEGELRVLELARAAPVALALGSYQLAFGPPQTPLLTGENAVAQATVTSLPSGPLEAQGEIKLSSRGWEAQSRLRATPRAQPALAAMLPALGPANAAGERQVLLSGSF